MAPRVSVITPVFNAAPTLRAAVASVRAQSLEDWELWLIDDGSTDGSGALARALAAGDGRIRTLGWSGNRGAAAARNAGIRASAGRHIAFLDADDLWRPDKLRVQTDYMARTGAGLVFSAYARIDAAGRPLGTVRVPARVDHARLLRGNVIGCLTAIYDTARFGRAEMPPLRRRQDFGLWLRLLENGGEAHGLDAVLAEYRVGAGSLSANKAVALAATWRLYREIAGLSRARTLGCMGHNIAGALRKRAGA